MTPAAPDSPEHYLGLLPDYANGTLGAAERARVRAHVAGCATCRAALAAWGAIRAATELALADPAPPAAGDDPRATVRAALADE
jgi:anti-sigma factor RsiW